MNRLSIATLNLDDGGAAEMLPEVVRQAGDVDLLMVQETKGWHRDGQRTRYRAEWLLASIGLDHSLMTASTRGTLGTLIFWRAGRMRPVAHYDAVQAGVPGEKGGLAEFAVEGFGPVVNAMSVQWATCSGDIRLDEARRLTRLAVPDAAIVMAGGFSSLWPDCAEHREYATPAADRRALTLLAEAGFRSAGCIAGVMTPTVDEKPDTGPVGRVDHIVVSPLLAGCVIPGMYAVHVSGAGNRVSGHRLVSVSVDLDQFRPIERDM
jgi:hypothetical protein